MAKKGRIGFIVIFFFLLTACQIFDKPELATPTPFSATAVFVQTINQDPIAISLADLAAKPEFFEGTTLQLTGKYSKLPRLVCDSEPHPSPVTWGIVGDGLMANAGGLDSKLRPLLTEGQQITAQGQWRQWSGPVGCGKSAPLKKMWYLAVSQILDPHPLIRNTAVAQIAELPPQPQPATQPPILVTQPVTDTRPLETAVIPTSTPTTIPSTPSPTVEATNFVTETPVSSATPTPISTLVTTTPEQTSTPDLTTTPNGTTTPEASPTSSGAPTPQVTSTNASAQTIDKGLISPLDLTIDKINANETHSWIINITTQNSAMINVAPGAEDADMVVSFIAPNGQRLIDNQNISRAGMPEIIENINLTTPGQYKLEIYTNPATITDYALLYTTNEDDITFEFKGRLLPNSSQTAFLPEFTDHFWVFSGGLNDTINIEVDPNSVDSDPYLELYGPDGTRITYINDGNADDPEALEDFNLPSNGLYTIRIGEFEFNEMEYVVTLSR